MLCFFFFSSLGQNPRELLISIGVLHCKFSHLNVFLWDNRTKLNQTWQGWSLGKFLSKLCPTAPPSIQDGCCYFLEISSIVHCCFIIHQNELKFNCSYMEMSSLTYSCFSVKFLFQTIYTVYTILVYIDKRSHLNLLIWNHFTKLNQVCLGWCLGGPLLKLCQTAPISRLVTNNTNFFHCLLMLYYKSKWAQILTVATYCIFQVFIFRSSFPGIILKVNLQGPS